MVYPYSAGSPVPDGAELLHLAADPYAPGRTHPVRFGTAGDPAASLESPACPPARIGGRATELAAAGATRAADVERFETLASSRYEAIHAPHGCRARPPAGPSPPARRWSTRPSPPAPYVRGLHRAERPGSYFFCRGGGLGWGMPARLLASPGPRRGHRCVRRGRRLAMYSPQALWTAAARAFPWCSPCSRTAST